MNRRKFIRNTAVLGASIPAFGGISCFRSNKSIVGTDSLIFKGGTLIDGSGSDGYIADILIRTGKIEAIGNFSSSDAYRIVNIEGLVITPGFIDIHSHTDLSLFINPRAESKIRQGVTTEITGQDGSSIAPLTDDMSSSMNKLHKEKYDVHITSNSMEEALSAIEKNGLGVNLATCVGLGTVRKFAIGYDNRPPTSNELSQMKILVDESFRAGAVGVSTGLEYTPGSFAKTDEIIELTKIAKQYNAPYLSHIRNEDNFLLEAVDEAITIGKEANVDVIISHLKVSGAKNWYKIESLLERIENANKNDIKVQMDRYPYIAYYTGLSNLFPLWSREGGWVEFKARLTDPSTIDSMKNYTLDKVEMLGGWNSVMIGSVSRPENKEFEGKRASLLAAERKEEPFEMILRLLLNDGGGTSMIGFGMNEDNTDRILSHPLCMICSDAGARATYGPLSESAAHPRAYGSFARILGHYVREKQLFDLPTGIKKMTSMPAKALGLAGRGLLSPGYFADLVVFDPEMVKDNATFIEPHQYSEGFNYVMVNGKIAVEGDEHTGEIAGKVIRNNRLSS